MDELEHGNKKHDGEIAQNAGVLTLGGIARHFKRNVFRAVKPGILRVSVMRREENQEWQK